jgi:glycosyltransferase involved in cell wall biosynthesis
MKITFVMAGGFSLAGGDRVVAIYAERLQKRGHEVFIVAQPLKPPSLTLQVKSILRGKGWLPKPVHGPSHFDPISVPHVRLDRYRPVDNQDVPDADVVISTWWETAEWVSRLKQEKGAKASFLQHFEAFDYLAKERVEATWKLPFHRITISKWLIDLARDRFDDHHVSLVRNSVDMQQFHAPMRSKQTTPTVGMLYSDVPWKGREVCLEAVARAAKRIGPIRVVAFGSQVKEPGVPPHPALPPGSKYVFRPEQDCIRDLYAACDVWLCGSRGEGFHLPTLEAMACRCPVVSTEVGGPIDTITHGENGYLVPVDDVQGLADHLVTVLGATPERWQQMSDAALATAMGYTWDDATVLFERALETAVQRRQRGEIA